MPASWPLLKLCLIVYSLAGVMVLLVGVPPAMALLQTLVEVLMLTGLVYLVLVLTGLGERFLQTLTALTGSGVVLSLIAFPLVIFMSQQASSNEAGLFSLLLFFGLVGWSLAVMAHVLRHALEVSRAMGMLYSAGYFAVSVITRSLLFPQ